MNRLSKLFSTYVCRIGKVFDEAMKVVPQILSGDLHDGCILWPEPGDPETDKLKVIVSFKLNVAKQFLRTINLFNFLVAWRKPNLLISQFSDRITFVIGVHNSLLSLTPERTSDDLSYQQITQLAAQGS